MLGGRYLAKHKWNDRLITVYVSDMLVYRDDRTDGLNEFLDSYDIVESIEIFVRNWLKEDGTGIDPGTEPREHVAFVRYLDQAQEMCDDINARLDPGPLGRKAELLYHWYTP